MNAIADALALRGATAPDMPATPEKIWRALHNTASTGKDLTP
jgi:CO/xanthine dehydrogenase Mo-binding subunit